MFTQNQMFLVNLSLTIVYCSLHLLISKHFKLKGKGIKIHICSLAIMVALHLRGIKSDINMINQGKILPLFTLVWFIIFGAVDSLLELKKLPPMVEQDVKIRCIAIIHGSISCLGASYLIIAQAYKGYSETQYTNGEEPNYIKLLYLYSLSYFLYHSQLCSLSDYKGKGTIYHHIISIFSLSYFFFNPQYYFYALVGISIGELTNPLMHIKAILNKIGFKHTKLSSLLEIVYIYSFIFMRLIVYISVVFIPSFFEKDVSYITNIILFGFLGFNVYIVGQMFGILKSRRKKYREMKDKRIQYQWFAKDEERLQQLSFYKHDTKDQ